MRLPPKKQQYLLGHINVTKVHKGTKELPLRDKEGRVMYDKRYPV